MSHVLRFLPEVANDALKGRVWYEDKAIGLGDAFVEAFYATVRGLVSYPHQYQKVHSDFRRCLLQRFPYTICYRLERDTVMVFGLFHCVRDPHPLKKESEDRRPQS